MGIYLTSKELRAMGGRFIDEVDIPDREQAEAILNYSMRHFTFIDLRYNEGFPDNISLYRVKRGDIYKYITVNEITYMFSC